MRTQRLVLRRVQEADRDALRVLHTSRQVREFLGGPVPSARLVDLFAADPSRLVLEYDGRVVGTLSLDRRAPGRPGRLGGEAPEDGPLELSYLLHPDVWGRGLMAEACRAVLDGVDEPVVVCTQVANAPSLRLARRLGFVEVERFEEFGAEQWFGVRDVRRRATLLHIDGPPGVGKSTLAQRYAAEHPGVLCCDIDRLRAMVGGWDSDFDGVGAVVRPLALAMIRAHLDGGHDVVLPQMLADDGERARFRAAAESAGHRYRRVLLTAPVEAAVSRFHSRSPDPVAAAIARRVADDGGEAALARWHERLTDSVDDRTEVVDASGDVDATYDLLLGVRHPDGTSASSPRMTSGVRPAGPEDDEAIASLRRAWVEEIAGGAVDDDAFERRFADWAAAERHQRMTWLAWRDGRAVGMLNVLVFTRMPRPGAGVSRWGYVANVYVLPEHRDRGVGREILDACLAHCDAEGFVRVVLSPSPRSVPFYARAGFEPATSLMVRPGPSESGRPGQN